MKLFFKQMRMGICWLILATPFVATARRKTETSVVFTAGQEGYHTFRIPAVIRLNNGNLLAFAEGRLTGSNDFGNIDLVMKRSTDNGKTWSPLMVIADAGGLQISNPAPVVDQTDANYPDGRVFLFFNTGTHPEPEIIDGKGIKRTYYITSTDGGYHWSEPVDITLQVHRPLQPAIDSAFRFKEDWRYYANTPGHGLQMSEGPYKGRIFIAANHSAGPRQPAGKHYDAHGFFTDDHGVHFKLSHTLNWPGSNESTAAELPGGALLMNSRNQRGHVKARIVSLSIDGGTSWDSTWFDYNLPDPVCQGSLLNLKGGRNSGRLAFSNPADTTGRNNLTLSISRDGGKTWHKKIQVYKGEITAGKRYDFSAYSDLVQLKPKQVGVLYEKNNYSVIAFSIIGW